MARVKIDYGIDLGTTNSAISRMEKGEPTIIKSDVLKDTTPSCISVNKKGSIKAGDGAYNTMKQDKRRATKSWQQEASNTYIEFKRTMATDTRYHSSHLGKDLTSEELSAEVLKVLKSFVTDEVISSAVITVPAKFTVNQKTATLEAAKLAGLQQCELLQEPIAAAMAYGLTASEKDGVWMVFDFGGGTFDAALLKVEDGIMQVFDTEGDNYLGGKNLDYAIVDSIIIPYLEENYVLDDVLADDAKRQVLRDAMKTYAEEAKNQLSFKEKEDIISNLGELGEDEDGEEIELDLTVTQKQVFDVLRPHFQKAVDICKELLKRNNLDGSSISKLILVGGPTHSPLIRQMLREQISPNVDTSIDPMTAVATGAALYASTRDAEVNEQDFSADLIKLNIGYEATSVESSEWVSLQLGDGVRLPKVFVELVSADRSWSTGRIEVGQAGNVVEVVLQEGRPNAFSIEAYDERGNALKSFPSEITIIQGTKVGAAPLPFNIGIATWSEVKKYGVFRMAKGLEKNKPLPAVGVINGLKTTSDLRPGVETDLLRIPVYQTDDFSEAEGKRAVYYEHVGDVDVSGEELDSVIPEGSLVDVTLRVDSSEQMKLEIHFLAADITIEKAFDTSKKHSIEDAENAIVRGLRDAKENLNRLEAEGISVSDLRAELQEIAEESHTGSEKKKVLENLKKVLRKIDGRETSTEWDRIENELRSEFSKLEGAQNDLGDDESGAKVKELRSLVDKAIRDKNISFGRQVLEQITAVFVQLTLVYQCMSLIQDLHRRFNSIPWRDASRARQLIDQGLAEMSGNSSVKVLLPIAQNLIQLMPDSEANGANGLLK